MNHVTSSDQNHITFETHPSQYKHIVLSVDGDTAKLLLNIQEEHGLRPGYSLKLNSYDMSVDIELADVLQRLRFEHPRVRAVVITSALEKIFSAGANIFMLGQSSHTFKVNFCKHTNETRIAMEEASKHSGLKFLCAANGITAGGGYELALACDEIALVDDGNSSVSLPEVPLLGVLPGTGGLTRLTDKRKVRRDLCDVFCTTAEGVKGERAKNWNLVDAVIPKNNWDEEIVKRLKILATKSKPNNAKGINLKPLSPTITDDGLKYDFVTLKIRENERQAEITISAPTQQQPEDAAEMLLMGSDLWSLKAFRELDDAILRLRFNYAEIGTLVFKTKGDYEKIIEADNNLFKAFEAGDWFAREVLLNIGRTLRRVDLTAKTLVSLVEPDSAYAGCLSELIWASDRSYMLYDKDEGLVSSVALSNLNKGALKMSNGLSRLEARFLGNEKALNDTMDFDRRQIIDGLKCEEMGLVTIVADGIDFHDEVRVFLEERASLSPDALTGMEANLRFGGPETMETKIFARLSAWQNWVFTRDNATGPQGALTKYGATTRPSFQFTRC